MPDSVMVSERTMKKYHSSIWNLDPHRVQTGHSMLLIMTVFQVSALTARGHASDTTQDRITLQNDILMSPDLASDPMAVLVYGQFDSRGGANPGLTSTTYIASNDDE